MPASAHGVHIQKRSSPRRSCAEQSPHRMTDASRPTSWTSRTARVMTDSSSSRASTYVRAGHRRQVSVTPTTESRGERRCGLRRRLMRPPPTRTGRGSGRVLPWHAGTGVRDDMVSMWCRRRTACVHFPYCFPFAIPPPLSRRLRGGFAFGDPSGPVGGLFARSVRCPLVDESRMPGRSGRGESERVERIRPRFR